MFIYTSTPPAKVIRPAQAWIVNQGRAQGCMPFAELPLRTGLISLRPWLAGPAEPVFSRSELALTSSGDDAIGVFSPSTSSIAGHSCTYTAQHFRSSESHPQETCRVTGSHHAIGDHSLILRPISLRARQRLTRFLMSKSRSKKLRFRVNGLVWSSVGA
jgi:hypothetical protein